MKKIKIVPMIITIVTIIVSISFLRISYININGRLYKKNTKEIYGINLNKINISEFNRLTNIEYVSLWEVNDNLLEKTKNFDTLRIIDIFNSNLGDKSINKLNSFNKIEDICILKSKVDLKNLNNKSIKKLCVSLTNVTGLHGIANCKSLNELSLIEITIDNMIIKKNSDEYNYVIIDSSEFATLDNIEILDIEKIKIEDISGILEMNSLKELIISKNSIFEDDRKTLENKGISIIEK